MPDKPTGEKTEKPTPRKLEKAKEEGQVAKSQELNTAFTLLASFLTLYFIFKSFFDELMKKMIQSLTLQGIPQINQINFNYILMENFYFIARIVGPILIAAAIIGSLISFLQVGPMFTPKLIQPKFSKINPIEGFKRLVSLKSIVELLKSLAKALVITFLAYLQIKNFLPDLLTMSQQGLEPALVLIAHLIFRIAINIIIFLVILGIADYIYQRFEFMKNMKMTKQEVKEEYKEQEGDPQIKSKRRQIQRQMSMNRMIQSMDDADLVITNPTHIAVALKYKMETMEAPVVVAKGEGYIAAKIKEKAQELGLEIVENKPLAQALNQTTEIGQAIPVELYQAVAEVLAFVYKQNQGKK